MGDQNALTFDDTKRAADMLAQGMRNSEVCAKLYICESTLYKSLHRHGLYFKRKGRRKARALSDEQIRFAARKLEEGMSYGELAEVLLVHKTTIRKSLKALGIFEYRKKAAT